MSYCPICKEWEYRDHKCPPKWEVWSPDNDETLDDAKTIYAENEEEAAQKFAEMEHREDADVFRSYENAGKEVTVWRLGADEVVNFTVKGTMEVYFHAEETIKWIKD